MPGFNTIPGVSGGGGQPNMSFVASVHMETYNRSWAQGGTAGFYGMFSANQENGYVYFVGATTTGGPLNRLINVTHSFTRIDIIAPVNDMVSLYKGKVKSTTEFANPFAAFSSFPSVIASSGNFVLPNNALPLVNVLVVGPGGGAGGSHHGGGGGGGGGIVRLTAFQAVGTTSVTIGGGGHGSHHGHEGGSTFFGNVYALGGGGGGSHNAGWNGRSGANGGGSGAHHSNSGGSGITQTTSTGLGNSGSPLYIGGMRGGNGTWGSNGASEYRGGGGGGGSGNTAGIDSVGSNNGGNGAHGHDSDITGSFQTYSGGGYGSSHNSQGGRQANYGQSYGFGGNAGRWNHNTGNGNEHGGNGTQGAVIVRYYIP